MKLRELKGERAIEAIADLIEPIANIVADQDNLKFFQIEKKKGEDDRTAAARDLKEKIPVLLRTHKRDILAILCTLNNADPEELSLFEIVNGMAEITQDEDFMSLFLSANKKTEQKSPSERSTVADHSEPES